MKSREIRRRDFMKTTVGGAAAGALLGSGAFAKPERSGKIIGIKVVQVLVLCALCVFAVSLFVIDSGSSLPGLMRSR